MLLQVPPELKEDLILIADKIEPYLLEVKEQAKKIPEKAHELAQKIEPAAEQLGEKIEQGAHKVHSNTLETVHQVLCCCAHKHLCFLDVLLLFLQLANALWNHRSLGLATFSQQAHTCKLIP